MSLVLVPLPEGYRSSRTTIFLHDASFLDAWPLHWRPTHRACRSKSGCIPPIQFVVTHVALTITPPFVVPVTLHLPVQRTKKHAINSLLAPLRQLGTALRQGFQAMLTTLDRALIRRPTMELTVIGQTAGEAAGAAAVRLVATAAAISCRICPSTSARRCITTPAIPKRRITTMRACMWRWRRPVISSATTVIGSTTAPTSRVPVWFRSCCRHLIPNS